MIKTFNETLNELSDKMRNKMFDKIFRKIDKKDGKKKIFEYFKLAIPILLFSGLIIIKFTDYFTDQFIFGISLIILSLTITVIDLYVINQANHQNLLYIPYIDLVKHFINVILINPIEWIINIFNYYTLDYFIKKK
jgi:hypothetical protein